MTSESISFFTMLGAWAAALATVAAVIVALWLPKKQSQQESKKAEINANKLIRAQLIIVRERVCSHVLGLKVPSIIDSPLINITYLPHEVLSAIDIAKLTSLYGLMHSIDSAEQSRKKAFDLLGLQESPDFKLNIKAYEDWVSKLDNDFDALIAAFKC